MKENYKKINILFVVFTCWKSSGVLSIISSSVLFVAKAKSDEVEHCRSELDIEPGKTVAIIGPSGCGKTTVIKLIARLFDPTFGKVIYLYL